MDSLFKIPEIRDNPAFNVIDGMDIRAETKKEYKARLVSFLEFMEKTGVNRDILVQYKNVLSQLTLGVSSKNKYFIVAKIFLRECTRIGMIKIDLSLNIKQFQQERKHKRHGHTTEQVRDILSLVNSYRDRAILSLLAYQGLRQIEIVRIELSDYNPEEKTLMVLGKGRDDKEKVHLHENVVKHLDSYIKANHVEGKIFDVTTRTIRNIHSRIAKKLGIKATTHGLRHHFTTKLLNAFEGDVKKVSSFTRHKSVETVMVYNDEREVIENDLPIFEETFKEIG